MGEHDGHRERLRLRFQQHGLDAMPDDQVLELLLYYAIPRRDTNPLARRLLAAFGSLSGVLEAPLQELEAVEGVSPHTAGLLHFIGPLCRRYLLSRSQVGQILNTTQACGDYLLPYFFGATEEMVYLLCLDGKCKALSCRLLQTGSVNSAGFSIRKAVEAAMSSKAVSVILAHNHTSGVALPSQADYQTTQALHDALEPLGILLADHIVVADNDFVSMADNGFFDFL